MNSSYGSDYPEPFKVSEETRGRFNSLGILLDVPVNVELS